MNSIKNSSKIVIATIICIGLCSSLQAQSWRKASSLPLGVQEIYTDTMDGLIYLGGGIPKDQTKYTNQFVSYDAKKDKWTKLSSLPKRRHHVTISTSNKKVYAIGGFEGHLPYWTPQSTTFVYTPETNSWTKGIDMPTPRGEHVSAVVDGKIYLIGGRVGKTPKSKHFENLIDTKINEVFNPKTNSWSRVANAPTARNSAAAVVIGKKIYVIGGRQNQKGLDGKYRLINLNVLEVYDTETNTWESKASIPRGRGGIAASVLNGKIYVFGGELWLPKPGVANDVWVYDPKFDKWGKGLDMNIPRHGLAAATIGQEIFVFGGSIEPGLSAVNTNEVLSE